MLRFLFEVMVLVGVLHLGVPMVVYLFQQGEVSHGITGSAFVFLAAFLAVVDAVYAWRAMALRVRWSRKSRRLDISWNHSRWS